jgi:N-acyl homoserine lactone hydrolase
MFEIYPIHLATLKEVDKSALLSLKNAGEKIDLLVVAWVISSENGVYIVDPGPGNDIERARKYHDKEMVLNKFPTIRDHMLEMGISLSKIKAVINTHLHWDHCIANDSFPDVPIIVQRKEYEYAQSPLQRDVVYYENELPDAPVTKYKSRFQFVEGDHVLEEGLELLHTPGHTPGHQSIKVSTRGGDYILAGDQHDLYENIEDEHPVGIFVNLFDWYRSTNKLKQLNAEILPSHDSMVMQKKVYR